VAVTVRTVSCAVTFDGVSMTPIVIGARGQVSADGGWPTCSVFLTEYPTTTPGTPGGTRIDEENDLTVVAGAGNNQTRFTGRVRRFRSSGFPKGIEMVAMGTLAYAAEWAPDADLSFEDDLFSIAGATDQEIIMQCLDLVPQLGSGSYTSGEIDGTSIVLGTEAPEAFDWKAGTSAWARIQSVDRATLYRTYQTRDGSIKRVRMIGHPDTANDFTLAPEDVLDGATGSRNTEQTRNAVIVRGHDYGDGFGPVLGTEYGSLFGYDGSDPDERFPEIFTSDLIEDGNDDTGTPLGYGGLDAQDIAEDLLPDVLKEFVDAEVPSWRDDTHGPGLTCLLNCLDRLSIGEPMWVKGYAWEVGDGWRSTYSLSGGGTPQGQTPPEV
jgi:hypothetical protein